MSLFYRQSMLCAVQHGFVLGYKRIFYFIYGDEFTEEVITFLHNQVKYFYPIDLSYEQFNKKHLSVISNNETNVVGMYNFLKFEGKFDFYQFYTNKQQKIFIEKELQINLNRKTNFNNFFIETLFKAGIRLSTSKMEPYLELAYYKQNNGIPLSKFELDILKNRRINLSNKNMSAEILKNSKFKINDIKTNNLFYKLCTLTIDNYGLRLIE